MNKTAKFIIGIPLPGDEKFLQALNEAVKESGLHSMGEYVYELITNDLAERGLGLGFVYLELPSVEMIQQGDLKDTRDS